MSSDTQSRIRKMVTGFVLLLVSVAQPSLAQETPSTVKIHSPVAREAMNLRFRRSKDPGLLMEQLYSASLFQQGYSHDEIVSRTVEKRREWDSLRRTGIKGEWKLDEKWATVVRLLGRLATQSRGGGSAGVEMANLMILYAEDVMRKEKIPRAAQRILEDFTAWEDSDRFSPARSVFDATYDTYDKYPDYRRTWDALFLTTYGFRPNASTLEVMENDPEFAENIWLRRISQETHLIEQIGADVAMLRNETHQAKKDIINRTDAILQHTLNLEETARSRRQGQIEELEIEGYRSAIRLAATVIGFNDRKLGRQILATGNAIFSMHDGIRAYEAAKKIGANANLAGLTLTWNVAGAALALTGVFMDTGPTADEIILEEIHKLQTQIQKVRQEMHGRFDQVHEHLDGIYESMNRGFDILVKNNAEQLRQLTGIRNALSNARTQLNDVIKMQLDTQSIMVRQGELLRDLFIELDLAPCTRRYRGDETDRMTLTQFLNCRAKIETLSAQLPGLQLPDPSSQITGATWLQFRPDRTISWSFAEFKRLLRHTGPEGVHLANQLPESVVGPQAWFYVVDMHDKFLAYHPDHAASDAEAIARSEFVGNMRRQRAELVSYAKAISDEVSAFHAGRPSTVFSKLLQEAWSRSSQGTLLSLVEDNYNRYYEDRSLSGIRVRKESGKMVSEISFEGDDPYGWRPMGSFYGVRELPEWIKVSDEACSDHSIDQSVLDVLRQSFHRDGILSFVPPEYVMLARLGLGHFDICGASEIKKSTHISECTNADPYRCSPPSSWKRTFMPISLQISFSGSENCVSKNLLNKTSRKVDRHARNSDQFYKPDEDDFLKAIEDIKDSTDMSSTQSLWGTLDDTCHQYYLDRFKEKHQVLSNYVRDKVFESEDFKIIERDMLIANTYLRSWFGLAFDNLIGRSDVVTSIVLGEIGFPDIRQMLKTSQYAGFASVLEKGVGEEILALKDELRSLALYDDIEMYGYGHRVLTGTHFDNIGGVD